MYGYESSATLTTDRLHYKLQTRPLVREGASRRRAKQFSGKSKERCKIWSWTPKRCSTRRHTDWLTVSRKVISSSTSTMVMSTPLLWQLTDCTTNYRPVLSSETKSKVIFRQKKGQSNIWSWAPKGCPTPSHSDWLTVSRKVISSSTSTMVMSTPLLWQLTDCTTNYRPALSSETKSKVIFRQKKGQSNIWSWAPKGCPTPSHSDWLNVSRKVTSTSKSDIVKY
jgi:hypothetical protein